MGLYHLETVDISGGTNKVITGIPVSTGGHFVINVQKASSSGAFTFYINGANASGAYFRSAASTYYTSTGYYLPITQSSNSTWSQIEGYWVNDMDSNTSCITYRATAHDGEVVYGSLYRSGQLMTSLGLYTNTTISSGSIASIYILDEN